MKAQQAAIQDKKGEAEKALEERALEMADRVNVMDVAVEDDFDVDDI